MNELRIARRLATDMGVSIDFLDENLDPRIEMTLITWRVRGHVVRLRDELAEHESKLPIALAA